MADLSKWAKSKGGYAKPPNTKSEALTWLGEKDREILAKPKSIGWKGNPPAWVDDEATWDRAKAAVEKYWDEYDEPYAVVASVYENMGGGTK